MSVGHISEDNVISILQYSTSNEAGEAAMAVGNVIFFHTETKKLHRKF